MNFSIGYVAPAIILPLRYYFSTYTNGANLLWTEDDNTRTIDIEESYDFNKTSIQEKPRIVVTRGSFGVQKTGITENLAEARPIAQVGGIGEATNFIMYQGMAQILIEARQKGTCELIADMVTHFILWTKPILCQTQGWKEFGYPLSVGDCIGVQDEDPNLTKFQVQLQVPWQKEEMWYVRNDGPALRKILQTAPLMTPPPPPPEA